ncbi:MAG: hypothetical protein KDC45_14655 [Bacteroidetes bacterium]|nr:hypothetical protein [Bacteroidota bacterium]
MDIIKNDLLDLRELLFALDQSKGLNAHLCTDLNCRIPSSDARPLASAIYTIIYQLQKITGSELSIDLDEHLDRYQITLTAYTQNVESPQLNDAVLSVLNSYGATVEWTVRQGQYVKIELRFPKTIS